MKSREGEQIDELFREGLDQGKDPTDFRERDWTALEQRLDRYARKKRAIVWLRPLSGVAAILLLALGIWALWPAQPEPSNQQVATEQQPIPAPRQQSEDQSALEEIPAGSSEKPTVAAETEAQEPKKQPTEQPNRDQLAAAGEQTTATNPDRLQKDVSGFKESGPAESIAENAVAMPTDSIKPTDGELTPAQKPNDQQSVQQAEEPTVILNPLVAEADDNIVSEPKDWLIALSVLVAPAYNGVDNLNNGKTGTDVGLMVTLGLSKRWSFSTGALYAKKLYETGFSNDYSNGNNGYGSQDIQTVHADCRVLDIPLNINYAIIDKGQTTISLGTGISSYIMLKEDYRFDSSGGYGENPADVHLVNENQHWLSVLNLHASYQQRLSSKMSLSLQPYLKIPVKDIGYARVRLQSLGMALSASWTL